MKSYTDIEQSRKLAEILPLESADMEWFIPADNEGEFIEEVSLIKNKSEYALFDKITDWNDTPYIPCWSLAALLEVLPFPLISQNMNGSWDCEVFSDDDFFSPTNSVEEKDSPVDACYEMILKLHELKML